MGHEQMVGFYADWTDRITAARFPPAPPRPPGIERNLVLTSWDAGAPTTFMHDVISTDKRNPKLNSNGNIYGIDYHNGTLVIMDPVKNTNQMIPLPTLDDKKNMRGQRDTGASSRRMRLSRPIGRRRNSIRSTMPPIRIR